MVGPEDSEDRRRGDIDLVVALQEQAEPHRPVLPLLPDLQDERLDVGRRAQGAPEGPTRAVAETRDAALPDTAAARCRTGCARGRRIGRSD
jgi:hypothetical protein